MDTSKTPVSILQELMTKLGKTPEYDCISQCGPPHKMVFEVRCLANGVTVTASARSKKDAKQEAARAALVALGHLPADPHSGREPNEPGPSLTHVALLRELCVEYRMPALELEEISASGPPHCPQFVVCARVGRHQRTAAAHSKKAARHLAAEQLYTYLRDCLPTLTTDFVEEEALVRAHERVMERYLETRPWRPDMSLRIADYHRAFIDALTPEQRCAASKALSEGAADAGEGVRAAAEIAQTKLQWEELPLEQGSQLYVLRVMPSCPPLSFCGLRPEKATSSALHYLQLSLDIVTADPSRVLKAAS